jgi:hypothetical protein
VCLLRIFDKELKQRVFPREVDIALIQLIYKALNMPPKTKLYKSKGKSDLSCSASTNSLHSNSINNPEVQEQFETELCWCIQQLQRALNSSKLNQKQVQENTRILNMLMNNSTPFIKKRQLMRLTFGDYRTKMMEEIKKMPKGLNIKIKPVSPNKHSKFMKKSLFSSSSDSNFKFNFNVENTNDKLLDDISKMEINSNRDASQQFHFINSDNTFKFNFNVDDK